VESGNKKQFTFLQLLGYIFAATTTVCAATWTVAKVTQSNELEAYRKAGDWKVSESITELRTLSSTLNVTLAEKKELANLRITAAQLVATKNQLAAVTADRDRIAKTLSSISQESEKFSVALGTSEYAVPNVLLVGVVQVYSGLNQCEVRIGDHRQSMEVGEAIGGSVSGIDYRLSLTKVTPSECDFAFMRVH
jgi:hypothetical protein